MSIAERVAKLTPIQFRYTPELDPAQPLRAGFSAQQVQEVFPDAVFERHGALCINLPVLESYIAAAARELGIEDQ